MSLQGDLIDLPPKMMKRKSDGAVLLLKYLEDERMKILDGILSVEEKWKDGVIDWYRMIEAHVVSGLLTNIGTSLFAEREQYVAQLRGLNVFPLTTERIDEKTLRKVKIANINLRLAIWLIHIRNV